MQPRPMVFGPVLWDKSPTKLVSSKKMGIKQGNVYEIASNFIDHCVWKWPQNLLSPHKNPRISGSRTSVFQGEPPKIWAGTPAGRHVFAGGFGPQRPPKCRGDVAKNATWNQHLKEDGALKKSKGFQKNKHQNVKQEELNLSRIVLKLCSSILTYKQLFVRINPKNVESVRLTFNEFYRFACAFVWIPIPTNSQLFPALQYKCSKEV